MRVLDLLLGRPLASARSTMMPMLLLCVEILAIITLVNLRGVRETGLLFTAPTHLFIGCVVLAVALGVIKTLASGGHPVAVAPLERLPLIAAAPGLWLLQAFSSGCTAMTGVQAVCNGVKAFREPIVQTAFGHRRNSSHHLYRPPPLET